MKNGAPATYKSDSVQSFEVGAKNNIDNRIRLATSVYYIKWNNIQENVVPPICQIQFTENLGNAVSKGFDLQADFQVTDAFSLESAFGFTDARYTTSTFIGPVHTGLPVVAAGDAIAGPNGIGTGYSIPPYSITLGPEYKFQAFAHESYVRADWEYLAGDKWLHASQDPNTSSYDPSALPDERAEFRLDARRHLDRRLRGIAVRGQSDRQPYPPELQPPDQLLLRQRRFDGKSRLPIHYLSAADLRHYGGVQTLVPWHGDVDPSHGLGGLRGWTPT